MKKVSLFILSISLFMQQTQASTLAAETIPNDPYKVKTYTLSNGLKVFVTVNKQAPRVQTMIAVKAGSKYDPAQTTGLAHYLEHMMFKGTHQYGTRDWASEKKVLDAISQKFEEHLKEPNEDKKKAIYAEIDSLSYIASGYAVPSEYDKMVGSLGASGTNAFTSNDMTVYVNDIPSNGIEKWARLESERFSTLVLRLFHTELETVYEEFNRTQDDDQRWSSFAVDSMLMPNHPYGTQTTIGLGEHLKNPSMVNIHRYFDTYYVPNNVAIIVCGDVDPAKTVATIEKYFSKWKTKVVPKFTKAPPVALDKIQVAELKGPTKEHVYIGYRFDGDGSKEAMMAKMLDMILSNGAAGLMDLNLIQKQKVLTGGSYVQSLKDYSIFKLYGEPKQGQTLEEVKNLLLSQIEAIKQGEFGEWLLPAIVQNLKLQRLKNIENNRALAGELMDAFVKDIPWKVRVEELTEMSKITKGDVVKFANENLKENYAVCYKRAGEPNRHKVDKPKITPVVLNKDSQSIFKKQFDAVPTGNITAKFIDFNKDIQRTKINGITDLNYIKNTQNPLFSISYVKKYGTDEDLRMGLKAEYFPYLGTEKFTNEQIKKEFYRLGITFKVSASRDRFVVNLSGLEENLEKGLELLQYLFANAKPDEEMYHGLVKDILKKRTNAKLNKGVILQQGLINYAKYGKENPFTYILSEKELNDIKPENLVRSIIEDTKSFSTINYYGQRDLNEVNALLKKQFSGDETVQMNIANPKKFVELPIDKSVVYYCDYNMKQAEFVLLAKGDKFTKDLWPYINLYNDYYGGGLSSIMFQEVREKMALAYAVNSNYGVPQYKEESHYLSSYIGTQADKMKTALDKMNDLLNEMVAVPKQFEGAKTSVIKNLESDWISGEAIFAAYDRAQKRGLDHDIRKDIYEKVKTTSLVDLMNFFNTKVKGKPYAYLVIGKKENIDFKVLESLGEVKQVSLEELFGY